MQGGDNIVRDKAEQFAVRIAKCRRYARNC